MKTIKNIILGVAASIVIAAPVQSQSKITVKGSDTMVILAQKWAELYMKKYPETSVQVTGTETFALLRRSSLYINISPSISKGIP